jgi:XTP/dITP diphosphohydrolase
MTTQILLASNNPHKLEEFRHILGGDYTVISPADHGLVLDVEETGQTFRENAILKAEAGARLARMLTIADDSGLEIDALGGEPGVLSARYGGPGKGDADRVALVLERLCGVPPAERTARFVAAIAVAAPGTPARTVEARVEGTITESRRGSGSFGYDPIFLYPRAGKSFAEMNAAEKSEVSHRGLALGKARELLAGW